MSGYLSEQTHALPRQVAKSYAAVWRWWEEEEPITMYEYLQVGHIIKVGVETMQ